MDPTLLQWLAACSKDPVAFVHGAFPWGEPGSLEHDTPLQWQLDILGLIRDNLLTLDEAVKIAVASGHGIGKSALVSWIILWGFTTLPNTRGRVTAGTETQLKTTTWAELGKWFNLFIGKENFSLTATALFSKDPTCAQTWRIDMVPWSESNPQAFAGMHNKGRRIIYIFDEGSTIKDIIYETAEGALTDRDTQIIWCVFGNPTKNSGRFRELFPGQRYNAGWHTRNIDSRDVDITNKKDIERKIELNGEDTDYTRIRITGQFPRRGLLEFFSAEEIDAAMIRDVSTSQLDPLALGVDVARFGPNNSVIFPRKGRDARSISRQVFNGLDNVQLAQKVFEAQQQYHADGLMVDEGGLGGGVVDVLRHMHLFVFAVQFGGKNIVDGYSTGNAGEKYANMRAGMYGALRAWLRTGAIPNDPALRTAMLAIQYTFNKKDEIQLVSKEDIIDENPDAILDDVDALALTFAYPLAKHAFAGGEHQQKPIVEYEYDPYSKERMVA